MKPYEVSITLNGVTITMIVYAACDDSAKDTAVEELYTIMSVKRLR